MENKEYIYVFKVQLVTVFFANIIQKNPERMTALFRVRGYAGKA
jgi:hypothetical protein